MMRHHLEQVHEEPGTHVSALHASEPAIYGRYGYGLASLELTVELGRGTTLTAPGPRHRGRRRHHPVHDRLRPGRPGPYARRRTSASAGLGAVVGDVAYYERICYEPPEQLRDKESWRVLFARRDGEDVGFAVFRRSHKWEKYRPAGELSVWLLVGDPVAQLVLLRRLVDFDLMGSGQGRQGRGGRPTGPLGRRPAVDVRRRHLRQPLGTPGRPARRRSRLGPGPSRATSSSRSTDAHAPWNDGRWRIHADATGQATRGADLRRRRGRRCRSQALGAAYLGGGNLVAQHRAGLVAEQRVGAVRELSQAMRTPVAPSAAMAF